MTDDLRSEILTSQALREAAASTEEEDDTLTDEEKALRSDDFRTSLLAIRDLLVRALTRPELQCSECGGPITPSYPIAGIAKELRAVLEALDMAKPEVDTKLAELRRQRENRLAGGS